MIVFEAINDQLQEIFVGASELPVFAMIQRLRDRPPKAIAHWNMKLAEFRSLQFDLTEDDARRFIRGWVKRTLPRGWRYLTEKTPADRS